MPQGGPPNLPPPPAPSQPTPVSATGGAPELSLSFGKGSTRGTSAPSSPAKSRESLLQRVQSLTGAARDQGASIIGAAVSSATRPTFNKDRCFTLMVIDDQNTDWSKYFRGKRLHGDYDIRVEQAEFREISLTANGDSGAIISMAVYRNGTKVARSFRPDFVLIRQPPRDGARDQRSSLLGLKYGGVPSINSLTSLYQFQDKPWVFAHLLQLQRRLGREQFPLIEQTFLPNPRELFSWQKFPCVLKAGHCHGGTATARLDNQGALQDAAGLLCGSSAQEAGCYCSVEPYIDAKFDVHIQKIGGNYKAFMRKSISGNWKTNQGSAMLESIPVTEKYKTWIDEISELFGGMEVCGLSVIVSKEGREFILRASDSTFPLMGDTQEEDRRQISDLVVARMQNVCRPPLANATSRSSISSRGGSPTEDTQSQSSMGGGKSVHPVGAPPPIPERSTPGVGSIGRLGSLSSVSEPPAAEPSDKVAANPALGNVGRRDSQASQSSTVSGVSNSSRSANQKPQSQNSDLAKKKAASRAQEAQQHSRGRTTSDTTGLFLKNEESPTKVPSSVSTVDKLNKEVATPPIVPTAVTTGFSVTLTSVFATPKITSFDFDDSAQTTLTYSSERVNPFDKSVKVSAAPVKPTYTPPAPISSSPPVPSHPPPPLPKTMPHTIIDAKPSGDKTDRNLDDLIKDRFQKNQGVRDQNTGRYSVVSDDDKLKSSAVNYASNVKTDSDKLSMDSKRFDYQKHNKNKFQKGGSLSDADIIFGGPKAASTHYSVDCSNYNSSAYTDPTGGGGDDDFKRRTGGAQSFSSSSSSSINSTVAAAPQSAYRGAGIQNDGFQDFDSPTSIKSIHTITSINTQSGNGDQSNKYSRNSSSLSHSSGGTSGDEYDLK